MWKSVWGSRVSETDPDVWSFGATSEPDATIMGVIKAGSGTWTKFRITFDFISQLSVSG